MSRRNRIVAAIGVFSRPQQRKSTGDQRPEEEEECDTLSGLAEIVPAEEVADGDVPLEWEGTLVGGFRIAPMQTALDRLVAHVLVHEIAHHFGYDDDRIAEIDDWRL